MSANETGVTAYVTDSLLAGRKKEQPALKHGKDGKQFSAFERLFMHEYARTLVTKASPHANRVQRCFHFLYLRQWLPVLTVLILYTLFGGFIFLELEQTNEQELIEQNNRDLAERAEKLGHDLAQTTNDTEIQRIIVEYQVELGLYRTKNQWDYLGAVYFAWTTYTTIGYGNIYPKTTAGRAVCILYSILGVPLFLYTMAAIGGVLLKVYGMFWVFLTGHIYKLFAKCGSSWAKEKLKKKRRRTVPVGAALGLFAIWMFLCTLAFMHLDSLDMFSSFYFVFISFTTIGYGDISPDTDSTFMAFPLVILAIAIISMTFNVIVKRIELAKRKTKDLLAKQITAQIMTKWAAKPVRFTQRTDLDKLSPAQQNWIRLARLAVIQARKERMKEEFDKHEKAEMLQRSMSVDHAMVNGRSEMSKPRRLWRKVSNLTSATHFLDDVASSAVHKLDDTQIREAMHVPTQKRHSIHDVGCSPRVAQFVERIEEE